MTSLKNMKDFLQRIRLSLVCFVGFLAVLFAQKPKKTRTKVALQPYLEDAICFARAKKFQTFLDGAILLIDEGELIDSVVAG